MMLMADPPLHTRMRRMVSRDFTPAAARALRPRTHELGRRTRPGGVWSGAERLGQASGTSHAHPRRVERARTLG
jgi:hypothetical protein